MDNGSGRVNDLTRLQTALPPDMQGLQEKRHNKPFEITETKEKERRHVENKRGREGGGLGSTGRQSLSECKGRGLKRVS